MARLYGPKPGDPPGLEPCPDLAGLSAMDAEGRPIGELFGTLAEEGTGLIRYLDVSLRDRPRHVLVPIGHTRVERETVPPRVRLRAATYEDLLTVPEYVPGARPDGDYQERLLEAHGRLFYGSFYYAHPAFDHRGLYAGEQPVVGPETAPPVLRLRPLSALPDFRIAEHETDVRGWAVQDADGARVGAIRELLVEPVAEQVRYVVLALDDPPRETVLPVGYVTIDRDARSVRTHALMRADLQVLPPFEEPLTREAENRILASLEGRLTGERHFQRPDFRRV